MLDQSYWVVGCTIGAILGAVVPIDFTGVDFAMTALFLVIVTEQWLTNKNHLPALVGIGASVVCLVLFGADNFIIPAMIVITPCPVAAAAVHARGGTCQCLIPYIPSRSSPSWPLSPWCCAFCPSGCFQPGKDSGLYSVSGTGAALRRHGHAGGLLLQKHHAARLAPWPAGADRGAIVVGLHLWKRNTLLSIVTGTVSYMLLLQFVF